MQTLTAARDAAEREATTGAAAAEAALSEVRSSLKLKGVEVARLDAEAAQARADLARAKDEIASLQAALASGRAEYARLDADTSRRIATLEGQLSSAKGALAVYEHLEQDMDAAVLAVGDVPPDGTAESGDEGGDAASGYTTPGSDGSAFPAASAADTGSAGTLMNAAGVPVAAARRMRQAVLLARQLAESQRTAAGLRRSLAATQAELASERQAGRDLARSIAEASQPHSYIVGRFRELEAALAKAEGEADDAREVSTAAQRELAVARGERDRAEAELAAVLARRGEAEGLASLVREALRVRGGAGGLQVDDVPALRGWGASGDARSVQGTGSASVRSAFPGSPSPPRQQPSSGSSTPPASPAPAPTATVQVQHRAPTVSAAPPAPTPAPAHTQGMSWGGGGAGSVQVQDTTGRVWSVPVAGTGGTTTISVGGTAAQQVPPAQPTIVATHMPMPVHGSAAPPPMVFMGGTGLPTSGAAHVHGLSGTLYTSSMPSSVGSTPLGGHRPPLYPGSRHGVGSVSTVGAPSPPSSVGSAGDTRQWGSTRRVVFTGAQ